VFIVHAAFVRIKSMMMMMIANVNFYAVRPGATRIRWNNAK